MTKPPEDADEPRTTQTGATVAAPTRTTEDPDDAPPTQMGGTGAARVRTTDGADGGGRTRRRRGRRVALGVYYAIVIAFTFGLAGQITWQIWAPSRAAKVLPGCIDGLVALDNALLAARAASEGFEGSPDEALARFREAAAPAWSASEIVAKACRQNAGAMAAYDVLERLRFAEESAIRRDARDLGPLRRRERVLQAGLLRGAEK